MMFLHTLRLAGDLSFYYAFAGFFAASFGGTPMLLVLVWPALCFGLASCFEGSRPLRTTLAALSAAALLLLPTGADKLCYFPAAVYPVLLAYTGDFALSPVHQAERLRWLCRVWPFFAVAMLLWNANAVLSAALPFATAAAVLLVGFNRTTRQDPEISTRPGYLLLSGGVLAAVCRAVPAQPQCCGCRCKGGCICRLLWRDRAGAAAVFEQHCGAGCDLAVPRHPAVHPLALHPLSAQTVGAHRDRFYR